MLSFSLAKTGMASIEIFDLRGKSIPVLAKNRLYNAGSHSIDLHESHLGAGTYLCRFTANGIKQSIDFVMAK
jgi:hypothetical protein